MKILVKYCGGCNPAYDRVTLVKEITKNLQDILGEFQLVFQGEADHGIMICGCEACCLDRIEVRNGAPEWTIVGPDLVNYFKVSQREVPQKIIDAVLGGITHRMKGG